MGRWGQQVHVWAGQVWAGADAGLGKGRVRYGRGMQGQVWAAGRGLRMTRP